MGAKNEEIASATSSAEAEFVISRVFEAPRELVFKAWTDPKHLIHWWGPRGVTNPVCKMDVGPGGAYRIVMRMPDGVEYPISGVFREVEEPRRLVMTQDCAEHPAAWQDLVKPGRTKDETNPAGVLLTTVTFEEVGGKTRVTVRTRFGSAAIGAAMKKMGMTEGWSMSLDRLAEHLAGDRELVITRVVDAPQELVWKAMTSPEHVAQWWGPVGFTMTIEQMDVRAGGVWKHVMHGPDGTDYPNNSVFKEVERPHRIVYTNSGGKKGEPGVQFVSTWTFEPMEGDTDKTRVTIRMVFATAADRDFVVKVHGAIEGGYQCLRRLAEHLAKMG